MTPHSTLLSKKPEHTWFCWTLFFFSYISVPEYFSNSALCAFVTQVKRTMKRQLWVTSSHRVWGRCSHSSATWCCHAWSVSCPLSITALPTIHLTSPIQTLHTHYLLSDSVCGEFVCRWTWMWAFVAFFSTANCLVWVNRIYKVYKDGCWTHSGFGLCITSAHWHPKWIHYSINLITKPKKPNVYYILIFQLLDFCVVFLFSCRGLLSIIWKKAARMRQTPQTSCWKVSFGYTNNSSPSLN